MINHLIPSLSRSVSICVYEWAGTGERSTGETNLDQKCLIDHMLFSFTREMDSSPAIYMLGRVLFLKKKV